jgi:hypothetical protein
LSANYTCSVCGAAIGPGEYKLQAHQPSTAADHKTVEERETWMCRRCALRVFVDDEDEDEDEEDA